MSCTIIRISMFALSLTIGCDQPRIVTNGGGSVPPARDAWFGATSGEPGVRERVQRSDFAPGEPMQSVGRAIKWQRSTDLRASRMDGETLHGNAWRFSIDPGELGAWRSTGGALS